MPRTIRVLPLLAAALFPFTMAQCAVTPLSAVVMPALTAAVAAPEAHPLFRSGLAAFQNLESGAWVWPEDESVDWVLLGVNITDPRGGDDQVWFVRLSTPSSQNAGTPSVERFTVPAALGPLRRGARITAPAAHVRIESFDHRGTLLHTSDRTVPGGDPGAGEGEGGLEALGRALAQGSEHGSDEDAASAEDLAKLAIALQQIGRCGALRPIRNEARKSVIHEPNIITLILNAFRINVRADFANAELMPEPWLPAFNVPQYLANSPLFVAGQHVVNCQVVLGPMTGPFALTAGLLGFEASHPSNPQNKLTVRVLATK